MLRWCRNPVFLLSLAVLPSGLAIAQSAPQAAREVVLPIENVRFDYAQVMAVRPVQQVLRTTRMERVCSDPRHPGTLVPTPLPSNGASAGSRNQGGLRNCRMAPVIREFQRTIAFDVDYVYRGSKFRTRMGRDPGNRLRIRISIAPAPME
ncbi:MAG: hypothetical protein IT472_11585 [Thermomonas sp.]|nr:hypothetical protein [Thermomonas sp.]